MTDQFVLPTPRYDLLRKLTIVGPLTGPLDKRGVPRPLWILSAGAPRFDMRNAYGTKGQKIGTPADNVFPLRVLTAQPAKDGLVPALVAIHLRLGAGGEADSPYKEKPKDDPDRLILPWADVPQEIDADLLTTLHEEGDASQPDAPFVQIIGEPLLADNPAWPFAPKVANEIVVPPFRLVAGRIPIVTPVKGLTGKAPNLAWLRKLKAKEDGGKCTFWLTPDGLEYEATLKFLGDDLEARVLLARSDGQLRLTTLELRTPTAWQAAWAAITPDHAHADDLLGLHFSARRGADLPTFRWSVRLDAKGVPTGLSDDVEVAGDALRIELVSPPIRGVTDGVASLRPAWVTIRRVATGVEFSYALNPAGPALTLTNGPRLYPNQAQRQVVLTCGALHLHLDAARLASELRAAQGIPTPPTVRPRTSEAADLDPAHARPLLSAFVPLADGWLQLPVPNLGPAGPSKSILLAEDRGTPVFDGYFRVKRIGPPDRTLSAYDRPADPRPTHDDAPWSATIEHATGIDLRIETSPGVTFAIPRGLVVELHGATLSTRGLLWISTDHPDADEALPRLGAGPGSFLDVPLTGTLGQTSRLRPVMGVELTTLSLASLDASVWDMNLVFDPAGDRWIDELLVPRAATDALDRARFALTGAAPMTPPDVAPLPAVIWRRHPRIPLTSAMPMTRAASSSVRPLESRDLIPFVHASKLHLENRLLLARLAKRAYTPLLELPDATPAALKLVRGWPRAKSQDQGGGIPFTALGLPGVELRCENADQYEAAVRYDLPALDEAFATAPLPPVPAPASPDERVSEPPKPVATALDWPLLVAFWADQARKLQNAQVVDRHLMWFESAGKTVDVRNLIAGTTWTTFVEVDTTTAVTADEPYGTLTLGGRTTSGDDALRGHSGPTDFTAIGQLALVGFSPPTFAKDEFHLDNRRVGGGAPATTGRLLSRPVYGPELPPDARLVSRTAPCTGTIAASFGRVTHTDTFSFWFKDVLVDKDGLADLEPKPLAFDVWTDDPTFVRSGFEWRLYPDPDPDALTLRLGRHRLPFFGLWLEPLRLRRLAVTGDDFVATIVCRLWLTHDGDHEPGDNLIDLTLTCEGDTFTTGFAAASLRFPLVIDSPEGRSDDEAIQRHAVLAADLAAAAVFSLTPATLAIRVAETTLALPVTEVSLDRTPPATGRSDRLQILASAKLLSHAPGEAALALTTAAFTTGYTLNTRADAPIASTRPQFSEFHIEIRIHPADTRTPLLAYDGHSMALFGQASQAISERVWVEGDGAILLRLTSAAASSFAGIPTRVTLCLAARLTAMPGTNTAMLTVGHCEGEIMQTDPAVFTDMATTIRDGLLTFTADARRRSPTGIGVESIRWTGTARISATVEATSAITWPTVTCEPATGKIPVPPAKPPAEPITGRVKVLRAEGKTTHCVTWTFADHHLPLSMATAIAGRDPRAVWATPVSTHHHLQRGAATVSWSSIEPVAIGAAQAIIPHHDGDDERTTFVPHFKHAIVNGEYDDQHNLPGMIHPGLGSVATVLQGTFSAAFREAFWSQERPGLVIAGGFLGVLRRGTSGAGPLLRLPVLAGIRGPIAQTDVVKGLELAWTDGPAARLVALTRPGAPAPANATLDAITDAMLAGSRPFTPLADNEQFGDPVAALLVEQSFAHDPNKPKAPCLATTPFFLAAAISLTRALKDLADHASERPQALSLVAGSVARRGSSRVVPLAAAFLLAEAAPVVPPRTAAARLVVLDDDVTVDPWVGPHPKDHEPLLPRITGLAITRHAVPRVGVLIFVAASRQLPTYQTFTLPTTSLSIIDLRDVLPRRPPSPVFPDHGRGPPAAPTPTSEAAATSLVPGWLYPVVEGPARPIRDDADTGIAGIARRLAPAAEVLPKVNVDVAKETDRPQLVWLSQTQIPVYLPLVVRSMIGPPVGWLAPAPAGVRLPTDDQIVAAVADSEPRDVQPFMPGQIDAASIGERAGVLTARRIRSLTSITLAVPTSDPTKLRVGSPAYDPAVPRFGSPAQAGSSLARKLRTPRPGPLPANTERRTHNRRVQASAVDPTRPGAAFIGSADLVEGESAAIRWSVSVVAAPELDSIISDRWDGSIRLVCVLDRAGSNKALAAETPASFLARVLLPTRDAADDASLLSRALLRIGDFTLPYRRLTIVVPEPEKPPASTVPASDDTHRVERANIDVILDPLDAPEGRARPALDTIAAALADTGRLPAVEVQWTVLPDTARPATWTPTGASRRLTVADAEPRLTASPPGAPRAPLTLRFPLHAVTAERGALPLTPITLLFGDPAYDPGLASAPFEHGARVALVDPSLQSGRGDLRVSLAADRPRVHVRGVITLLADIRYEKVMNDVEQLRAEQSIHKVSHGGDHVPGAANLPAHDATLTVKVQPRDGQERPLKIASKADAPLAWSTIYELPIAALREQDDSPARLAAGDSLTLEMRATKAPIELWDTTKQAPGTIDLKKYGLDIDRVLRLILTDDPVIEPPPALYAALVRMIDPTPRVFAPLHAQSPLPHRVDLLDPLRDFRRGMLHRRAFFVWTLLRPRRDLERSFGLAILKWDRNGQTHIPTASEFLSPERPS